MDLNEYLMAPRADGRLAKRITCKDGFSLSVQASEYAYCSPRQDVGPWYEVEVGFPSSIPTNITSYAEQPENPTGTVYGYVPICMVESLIKSHGGMV